MLQFKGFPLDCRESLKAVAKHSKLPIIKTSYSIRMERSSQLLQDGELAAKSVLCSNSKKQIRNSELSRQAKYVQHCANLGKTPYV